MNKALRALVLGFSVTLLLAVVSGSANAQSRYTITQITSGAPDHISPAINNNGDIVWTQVVNGFSQVYILAKGQSSPSLLPGQQANHNNEFPVIDDAGNVAYLKDGVGGGAGLVVVRNSAGVETTIEFSSGNPPGCTAPPAGPVTCTAFRTAGQHFGVSGNGTIISYFDFTFSGTHTRRFDVTGIGTLQCGGTACDFGFEDYPSINNQGDFIFTASGQIQKSSLANPSPMGTPIATGTFGRINNSGDVAVVSAGQVQVYLAPDYSNSRIVHTGTWAGIDDTGIVVFQDVDGSGVQQIFRAVFSPQAIDISDYNDPTTGLPADPYALTAPFWAQVHSEGTRIAVVSGFGGQTSNSNAATLLNLARTTQGGIFTALYCFLNYQETGTVQIAQHCLIPTLGESAFLKFVAVDVEPAFVGSSTLPQRIQIIGDAVKAVTQAGLIPVMYTNRCAWNLITNNSTLFSGLPLWDVANDLVPDLATDFFKNCQGTQGPIPFVPYGGWLSRAGKQYDLGSTGNGTRLFTVDVDFDVFLPSLFSSSPPPNTPQGNNVSAQPLDSATGTTPVTVSFASIQQAGTTTVSTSSSGPAIPSGFQLGLPPIFYDVATSANFTPPVVVCINYSLSSFANQSSLRLLHFEDGSWVDQTYSQNPPIPQTICALVSSLSPFVVVQSSADTIPPVSTETVSPNPNSAGWNDTNVTVALNSADNETGGTGVKQITYSATGAQTIASTIVNGASASFTISTEGITTITFFGTDNAGNVEAPHTLIIRLDKTPPTITGSATPASNANGWNNTNVTVSFQCADSLSGLAAGSPPAPTTLSTEGTGQFVTGTCTDVAGNSASSTVSGINIDKTPPTIACSVSPNVLWPPNNKLVPVNLSVSVTDALSGPAGFTLVSVTNNEPDSGQGDIQGFATGTAATTGQLRAQRLGSGTGRVYAFAYSGADKAGNTALCAAAATVPHDQGKN